MALAGVIVPVVVAGVRIEASPATSEPPLRFAHAYPAEGSDFPGDGSSQVVAQVKDPDGGPDWALRVFDSHTYAPGPAAQLFAHSCIQLGRFVRGQFGWIDSANVFRPVRAAPEHAAPIDCGRAYLNAPEYPRLGMVTLTSDLQRMPAHLTRAVVWGIGPHGTKRVDLRIGPRSESPALSHSGAFIAFERADTSRASVSAGFERARVISLGQHYNGKYVPPPYRDRPLPAVGARAPDPNGGLPWGVGVVPSDLGGVCLVGGPVRVIGDRVGYVDFRLGAFDDERDLRYRCNEEQIITRKYLVALETNYSTDSAGGPQPGDDPARGRVARRSPKGYTVLAGRTRADVIAVTIATPNGVRTLTPSGPAHAFVTAYAGSFRGGRTIFTVRFRDGRTQVVKSPRF